MSYAPIPADTTFNEDQLHDATPIRPKKLISRSIPARERKTSRRRGNPQSADTRYPLIVHCHLCWDWVWQRPQQFISRLSHRHKTLFVETLAPDPSLAAPLARFRPLADSGQLTLLSLQFPSWRWQDGSYVDNERRRLVQEFLAGPGAGQFENPVQWFYDPMAVPAFAGHMGEILTVYDCMDELSKFRGAPSGIVERERDLLALADVVFAGGRKLYEAKSRFHPNCHFYGCGVDNDHFGRARAERTEVPHDLAALPKPVLGYFGVIDERMDYELVAKLADANPRWSVALIGPVSKVNQELLPRRANLHWFGQRPYSDLPAFCKGFDVCLMPFALNEATEFINPTKALEYMAAGRQIVSTPVPDVVRNFGEVVRIGKTHQEFIDLCRNAVAQPDSDAVARGLTMAGENSWDAIVARLEGHIETALGKKFGKLRFPAAAGAGLPGAEMIHE